MGRKENDLLCFPSWSGNKDKDSTVILGQKSSLELFQQKIEQELSTDLLLPEPVDKKIALVEKLAQCVGLDLNISHLEEQTKNLIVDCLGQTGSQAISDMKSRLQSPTVPQGLGRHQSAQRKKDVAMLTQIIDDNSSQQFFDPFKEVKYRLMTRQLNMSKKEHDIIFIKPNHKTIGQIEVKAMTELQSQEVSKAIQQLAGGKEEIMRVHGHLLDPEWSYLGVICLPNLSQDLKLVMCRNLKICDHCADFILIGNLHVPMKSLLDDSFLSEYADKPVWQDQYTKLASRILSMQHLNRESISTVKRITGREKTVVAAFTEGHFLQHIFFFKLKQVLDEICSQEISCLSYPRRAQMKLWLGGKSGTSVHQLRFSFSLKNRFIFGRRKGLYSGPTTRQVRNNFKLLTLNL